MHPADVVLVLTTLGSEEDASRIAAQLVESRLAACVNVIPAIQSFYRWEGTLKRDDEWLLLIKTSRATLSRMRQELLAMHPYQVPEFLVISIDEVSEAYGKWIAQSAE